MVILPTTSFIWSSSIQGFILWIDSLKTSSRTTSLKVSRHFIRSPKAGSREELKMHFPYIFWVIFILSVSLPAQFLKLSKERIFYIIFFIKPFIHIIYLFYNSYHLTILRDYNKYTQIPFNGFVAYNVVRNNSLPDRWCGANFSACFISQPLFHHLF